MLIKNKTDLINYLNKEIEDKFVIDAILYKLNIVKEKYNIKDTYKLEVTKTGYNKYLLNMCKIEAIDKIVATLAIDVE